MDKYKGYAARVTYSHEDDLMVGQIENIEALVMFSAGTVEDLKLAFHAAVDDYLNACEMQKLEPERPYKGSFNVRIGPERHRRAAQIARSWKVSLNEVIGVAVDQIIDRNKSGESVTLVQQAFPVPELKPGYVEAGELSLSYAPAYSLN
jgi:predicted HicB family RNase H-like nuclease